MPLSGPTQGAERHAHTVNRWKSHPWLARLVRVVIMVAPLVSSIGFTWWMGRVLPPARLGVHQWVWVAMVFVAANVLLLIVSRLMRRLMPLVALMKMTLVFPDNAPPRTKAALRRSNSRTMLREMEEARARGETTGAAMHGDYLVQLLKEVNDHDRLTRGHSERVRAYSELLGDEMGLDEDDLHKLRWAALLHDVGKLSVPHEVLNKDGRPTDEEWQQLQGHPAAATPMLEPLRPWLGDWLHAADQHHCRWDGNGYPVKLAGTDISYAGRLVAIADAYDVMTSARSYKQPLSPELARLELTDCAGGQFDPTMVRSFLRIGLGRLKTVAGPLAWLANLTGSAQIPVPAASTLTTGAWSVGVATIGVTVAAIGGITPAEPAPEPVEQLAFVAQDIDALDVEVLGLPDAIVTVTLTATGTDAEPVFVVSGAGHGNVGDPGPATRSDDGLTWTTTVTYEPDPGHVGEDGFTFEACTPGGACALGKATVTIVAPEPRPPTPTSTPTPVPTATPTPTQQPPASPPPFTPLAPRPTAPPIVPAAPTATPVPTTPPVDQPPTAVDDAAATAEDVSVLVDVVANDTDPEAAALAIAAVADPLHGAAVIEAGRIRYTPAANYFGFDVFSYTISDGVNTPVAGFLTVSVTPVNDVPQASATDATVAESAPVGAAVLTVAATDVDGDTLSFTITGGDPTGRFTVGSDGIVEVGGALDHETLATVTLEITVSDGLASTSATPTISIVDLDEPPVAVDDADTTTEDTATTIDLGANDTDPEGRSLTWNTPATSVLGGTVTEVGGVATYTPPADVFGSDTFTYTVGDPAGNLSAPATVTIAIAAVNDAPVAGPDFGLGFTTPEDTVITTRDLTSNDADVDHLVDPTSLAIVSGPTNGLAVDNNDGTVSYTPNANHVGPDSFSYTITDADGAVSNTAAVTIVVSAVNDPPMANADGGVGFSTVEDTAFTTPDVTANDTDVEDGTIDGATLSIVTGAANGTVVDNGDGTIGYTPDADWNGTDTVTYSVTDTDGAVSNTATITMVVTAVNDPPVANDDTLTVDRGSAATTIDVRLNDTDVENGALTVTLVADGAYGTTVDNANGTITYTHDGTATLTDSFTYTVTDAGGASATADVTVTIDPPEDNDGVAAATDVCPDVFDPAQRDTDGDTIGDACDPMPTSTSTATFGDSGERLGGTDETHGVALGDIDGDGDLDAVFANGGDQNAVFTNDGSGDFSDSGQTLGNPESVAVVLNDFDGDGDLDAVFANRGGANTVFTNDGSGAFTNTGQALGTSASEHVAVGDFDGDGDLDLAFANDDAPNTIWLNNGSAVFTTTGQAIGVDQGAGVAAGDIDGDGDLDLVFAHDGAQTTAWTNNGSGTFTDSGQSLGAGRSHDPALVDLDGDGDLDLVVAEDNDGDRVWLNNGSGVFADNGPLVGNNHSRAVVVGDLDGDGDPDLVLGDHTGATNTVWLNNGSGGFTNSGQTLGVTWTEGMALGDVNGDGRLDLLTANNTDPNRVWLNS